MTYLSLSIGSAHFSITIADAHWPWITGCIALLIILKAYRSSRR